MNFYNLLKNMNGCGIKIFKKKLKNFRKVTLNYKIMKINLKSSFNQKNKLVRIINKTHKSKRKI